MKRIRVCSRESLIFVAVFRMLADTLIGDGEGSRLKRDGTSINGSGRFVEHAGGVVDVDA